MKCRIIGLESRKDRNDLIPAEMAKLGIDWEWFFVEPFKEGDDMMRIASKGFIDVLKGVEGGLLVCESDVTFVDQAKEIFRKAYKQLPSYWDLLYLGGNIHEPAERWSTYLNKIKKGVHCNHAILYSEKGRERMLKLYDPLTDENPRIDDWLYHVGQNKMSCFICSPIIAYQRPSYSDTSKKMVDYYIEMRSHEIEFMK
jgi:hypothetical protein